MRNIEEFREFCLSFKGVQEKFPFDNSTLVFYVMDKMFCLVNVDMFEYTNLKCDPIEAEELRGDFFGIKPGYHMNKKHWNSVYFNEDVPNETIKKMVVNSYNLVVSGLNKKNKEILKLL